jgi:hypothetical protein
MEAKKMTRVAVVTPVWGRHVLYALWKFHMRQHVVQARRAGIDLRVISVVTDPQGTSYPPQKKQWEHFQVEECANDPLGAKFNHGFKAAKQLEADYVTVIGPDEFFRPVLWWLVAKAAHAGTPCFGFRDAFLWDLVRDKGCYWPGYVGRRHGETIGAARFTHRSILDLAEWAPYDGAISRVLDYSFTLTMARLGVKAKAFLGGDELMLTSAKDATAKTPMSAFVGQTKQVHTGRFIELFDQFA